MSFARSEMLIKMQVPTFFVFASTGCQRGAMRVLDRARLIVHLSKSLHCFPRPLVGVFRLLVPPFRHMSTFFCACSIASRRRNLSLILPLCITWSMENEKTKHKHP